MTKTKDKYYCKFSFLPTKLSNGRWLWFKVYHEANLTTAFVHNWVVVRRIDGEDYIIETLKGDIIDGIEQNPIYKYPLDTIKHIKYGKL